MVFLDMMGVATSYNAHACAKRRYRHIPRAPKGAIGPKGLNEEAEYKRGVARSENGRQETDCSKIQKCLRASCTMNIHYTHITLFEAQNKANKA